MWIGQTTPSKTKRFFNIIYTLWWPPVKTGGFVVNGVYIMGTHTNIGFERWLRLTRRGCARHPLFASRKEGFERFPFNYLTKYQSTTFQTPLSGEAEERVPLAKGGLAGESSTPGYLRHFPTITGHRFIAKNSISRA